MTPIRAILRMRVRTLWNRTRSWKLDSLAKASVVLFGLALVLSISFGVSLESLRFIERIPAFGAVLNSKVISLLFFTLLILVALSTVIVTYTTVFVAKETDFFFQHPIPPTTVLGIKLAESIAFSSWATLILCLPVLVAFGIVRQAGAAYYVEASCVLVVFLLFAGFAGTALTLLIAPLVRLLSGRQLLLCGCMVLAGLGWMFLRSFNFWGMDGRNDLLILNQFLSHLPAMQSAFFPGQWAASAVLAAAANNHREVCFQGATLLANTLIFLPIFASYGTHYYGREWLKSRSPSVRAPRRAAASGDAQARRTRRWLPYPINARARTPLEALVLKDVLVFVRDPAQLSQSLLFVLLMVIYSLSLLRIPEFTGQLRMIIHFANLLAVCMILSSFTSRFLFPLISLEGRSFWIVGLAPISRRYLVLQKAVFGLGISSILGLVTVIVSNVSLRTPPDLFFGAAYATILAAVALTFLATGLGAAFPAFDEDNPARIAVGIGGTLNFVASALAVALIIAIEAAPWILAGPAPGLAWKLGAHAAATAFTAVVAWACFRLGSRSVRRRDF